MSRESVAIVQGKDEQGPFVNFDLAALPAAGAFTGQAYTPLPAESRRLSIVAQIALGAGATTNQAKFRLQWQIDGALDLDVSEAVIDGTTIVKTAPYLANPQFAYEVSGPVVTGALAWRLLSVEVPIKATGVRVLVAEVGDTTHPSSVAVIVYASRRL